MPMPTDSNLFLIIATLSLGIFFLIKGADWLVESAAAIAQKFKISELIIGLLVVSIGTSLPELVVSLFASSSQESNEIVVSNVLGSNIANVLLVLGLASLCSPRPLQVPLLVLKRELPISLFAILLFWALVYFDPILKRGLSLIDGLTLGLFFLVFVIFSLKNSRAKKEAEKETKKEKITEQKEQSSLQLITFLFLGMILLNLGGKLTVDSSIELANYFKLSKALIGLTVIALGTSLPELVTTSVSCLKNKNELALGNVIGSNIFNIFFVLGVSSLFKFITFKETSYPDLFMAAFASVLLPVFLVLKNEKKVLTKIHGSLFLLIYFIFIIYRINFS